MSICLQLHSNKNSCYYSLQYNMTMSVSMVCRKHGVRHSQSSSTLLLTWLFLLSIALQGSLTAAQNGTVTGQGDLALPYLIFTSYNKIYQMYFNETEPRELLQDPSGGITVVDYHYRLGLVFWMTSGWPGRPSLKQAHLSNGSNMTVLASYPIDTPAGLAVDWINDKVYWSDSYRRTIEMYDLTTGETRTVIHLQTARPIGLAIFPLKDYGWLYTMDKANHLLYRIPVDGSEKDIMRTNVDCPGTVTLEHRSRSVYWSDVCTFEIQTSKIDGSNHSVVVGAQLNTELVRFSFGLGYYQSRLYWTQQRKLVKYDVSAKTRETMFSGSETQQLNGLQVVHPSKQPSVDEMAQIEMCTSVPCENGDCIPPGLCACRRGWSGSTCANDVNECLTNNGGCSHICTNLPGSFRCSCPSELILQANKRDCRDFDDTGVNFPNTTNSTTTSSTSPTESTTTSVVSSFTPLTSFVASLSPTRTQSSFISTTDITVAALTSFTSTIHPSETTSSLAAVTTSIYSTVSTTLKTYSIQSTPLPVVSSSLYSTLRPTSSQNSMTSDSTLDNVVTTILVVGVIPSDGITEGKLDKNSTLLVIFGASFGVLIIIVSVIIYLLVVYWRYRQRRKGSYTIQRRQRRRRRDHDVESATSSARSSFRPVSEFYFHYTDYDPNQLIPQEVISHENSVPRSASRPSVSADSDSSSNSGTSETQPLDAKLN